MKLTFLDSLLIALLISFNTLGFAAEGPSKWEIWTGSLAAAGINKIGNNYGVTSISVLSPYTFVGSTPSIGYIVGSGLEIQLSPDFLSVSSNGTTITNFGFLAGVNYSWMSDFENSWFVEAEIGFSSAVGVATSMTWLTAFGKRMSLTQHVTYAPEITFAMDLKPITVTTLGIVPLQFSLLLSWIQAALGSRWIKVHF